MLARLTRFSTKNLTRWTRRSLQERSQGRRGASACAHQSRQGADGRSQRVPLRHHPRRRRSADNGGQEQRSNADRLRRVSIIGGIVIVLVVGGAAVTVVRYTRDIVTARDEVARSTPASRSRVKERTADLARANEEVQRFAYIVTHDLRAPLVNIMGFTSELESGVNSLQALIEKSNCRRSSRPGGRAGAPRCDRRLARGDRLHPLLDQEDGQPHQRHLEAVARGTAAAAPRSGSISRISIEASVAAIQHQLSEAEGEIKLNFEVLDRSSPTSLPLEQVFGNLLDNAVKFRSRDRPLQIEVRRRVRRGRITIEVTDNGRGIAEQDLERVFELFRRSGVQDQPGEGIGLAHVARWSATWAATSP